MISISRCFVIAMLSMASLLSAQTRYYVKNGGNDAAAGTSDATAWATFANINSTTFSPGTTIHLKCGSSWTETMTLSGSGTLFNMNHLQSYGTGAAPTIRGTSQSTGNCLEIGNAQYWRIEGLALRNSHNGVILYNSTGGLLHGVEVHDCRFTDMDDRNLGTNKGIIITGDDWRDISISNCVFDTVSNGVFNASTTTYNMNITDCEAFGGLSAGFSLIEVVGGTVARFHVHDVGGPSLSGTCGGFLANCTNVTVTDCTFSNVMHGGDADGVGFDFEGGNHNCTLSRCSMFDNEGGAILIMSGGSGTTYNTGLLIEDCLFYNNNKAVHQSPWYSRHHEYEVVVWAPHPTLLTGVFSNVAVYKRPSSLGHFNTLVTPLTFTKYDVLEGMNCDGWKPVYGVGSKLDVGGNNCITRVDAGRLFAWNGDYMGNCWDEIICSFASIRGASIGCDGELWAVMTDNSVWRHNGGGTWSQRGTQAMNHVSVGHANNIWGVDTANSIFRWNPSTSSWQSVTGALTQVDAGAVAGEGAWGVVVSGGVPYLYRYSDSTSSWQQVTTQSLDQVSGAFFNAAAGVSGATVFHTTNGGASWTQLPGALEQVSLGSDGTFWGRDSNGHIWRYTGP